MYLIWQISCLGSNDDDGSGGGGGGGFQAASTHLSRDRSFVGGVVLFFAVDRGGDSKSYS